MKLCLRTCLLASLPETSCHTLLAFLSRYHSHFKGQYMDGLRGALVVDPKGYKTPPSESVLNVFDW